MGQVVGYVTNQLQSTLVTLPILLTESSRVTKVDSEDTSSSSVAFVGGCREICDSAWKTAWVTFENEPSRAVLENELSRAVLVGLSEKDTVTCSLRRLESVTANPIAAISDRGFMDERPLNGHHHLRGRGRSAPASASMHVRTTGYER